jgi:uncharacterized membrane protein YdbT with pleckstrin-like domain
MSNLQSNTEKEKIIFRGKSNKFLFVCKMIHQIFWLIVGTVGGVLLPTMFFSGIAGFFCNDGKLNQPILCLGISLIPIIIACRIAYLVWLRRRQYYTITDESITCEGGVLHTFNRKIRIVDIRSISYHCSLIQQLLGCGNIIISSAASSNGSLVLKNIDNVKNIYNAIENNRKGRN